MSVQRFPGKTSLCVFAFRGASVVKRREMADGGSQTLQQSLTPRATILGGSVENVVPVSTSIVQRPSDCQIRERTSPLWKFEQEKKSAGETCIGENLKSHVETERKSGRTCGKYERRLYMQEKVPVR